MSTRTEKDSMGEVKIPRNAYYGASTQRAKENFNISNRRFSRSFIHALGLVKWASAMANIDLNQITHKIGAPIAAMSLEVANGQHDKEFVVDVFQTGSGTSTNMNANEVIANLANVKLKSKLGAKKPVHPNDHVNLGQSSNDVIPTAIHVSATLLTCEQLLPELEKLALVLKRRSKEFKSIIKIGRTHLQDATPMTFGQEFSGFEMQIKKALLRLKNALPDMRELAIGGTAIGTGLNTHPQFGKKVCSYLKKKTGVSFKEASNHFEAQSSRDACVFFSGALRTLAIALLKISNDLRWLSSGPRTGLHEISLKPLQPGSSIMPGKVNPVLLEAVMQVGAQVQGNDLTISLANQHGNLQLNVMMPVIASNLLESIELLTQASRTLAQCVGDLEINKDYCAKYVEQSLSLATNLNPKLGYDKASELVKKAYKESKSLHEVLKSETNLSDRDIQELLNPWEMIAPKSGTQK